jgi:hypothetical protein
VEWRRVEVVVERESLILWSGKEIEWGLPGKDYLVEWERKKRVGVEIVALR